MRLEWSRGFEDIRFLLRYLNREVIFEEKSEGIRLIVDDERIDGLDDVLRYIGTRYENELNDKKMREMKRLRMNPEIKKVEVNITNLMIFYRLYSLMITEGTLKNKTFIDQMAGIIKNSLRIDVDFRLLDVQVGEIIGIEDAHDLDKLYCEDVMVRERIRVLSGLREHVKKESMMNNKYLFVTNMKPIKFKGLTSEGMILCAKDPDGGVEPIELPRTINNGSRLCLEGYEMMDEIESRKIDVKKSAYASILNSFMIVDHFLTFKGIRVTCDGEYIKTMISNGSVS